MSESNDIKELSVRPVVFDVEDEDTLLVKRKTSYGETNHRVYDPLNICNSLSLEGDVGNKTLVLSDYYEERDLDVSNFKAPPANSATLVNRGMGSAWRFDDGNEESIRAEIKIPCCWKSSGIVRIRMIWDSPATSLDCDWEIRYLFRKDDDDMTETTPDGTIQSYETSSANANGLTLSIFDIPATNFDSDDRELNIEIFRDGDDANDTLSNSAYFHSIAIVGVADTLGRLV